jgi:hypothetical protein
MVEGITRTGTPVNNTYWRLGGASWRQCNMNTLQIYNPLLRNVFSKATFRLGSLSLGKHRQVCEGWQRRKPSLTHFPKRRTKWTKNVLTWTVGYGQETLTQGRPDICGLPGMANNFVPLKTDILWNFSVWVRAGELLAGACPNGG